MLMDKQLLLSSSQAITAAAASTNLIDLNDVRDIGTGQPLYLVTVVKTAFTDSGSNSTLTVSLRGDTTTTITPDATQDLFTIPATAAVGDTFIAALDPGAAPLQYQYIDAYYTPNNGDLSAGAVTTFLTRDIHKWKPYAKNYSIS